MKVLFIAEKPSIAKIFINILKKDKLNEYYVDYIRHVTHYKDNLTLFREKDLEYYAFGEKTSFRNLSLNDINIPSKTFLEIGESKFAYQYKDSSLLQECDKIISICDTDDYGVLAFAKYIEENNIDKNKCLILQYGDLTEKSIKCSIYDESKYKSFDIVYEDVKKRLKESNFQAVYPREKNPIILRIESGMSRVEFAEYFNIPYRTMENWERKTNTCPEYLYDLMEYKLKQENKIIN